MNNNTISKNRRAKRRFERKAILLSFFLLCISIYTYFYASNYKPIYRLQVLDKQGIKLLKENSNLNRKRIMPT